MAKRQTCMRFLLSAALLGAILLSQAAYAQGDDRNNNQNGRDNDDVLMMPGASGAAAPSSMSCYKTMRGGKVAPITEFQDGREVINCASYQFKCTRDELDETDPGCTQAEVAAGTWKWRYHAKDADDCAEMKMNTLRYRNVACCTTPNCNKPDASLDATAIVEPAAAAAGTTAAAAAATTPAGAAAGFSCYKSMRDTVSAVPDFHHHNEPKVCAAYEFKCKADDTDDNNPGCTAAEAAAGTWKWRYDSSDADDCAEKELKTMRYRNVKCCSTPNCNIPDPTLDPKAKVVAAAPGSTVTEGGPGAVTAGTAAPLAGPAAAQGALNDPSAASVSSRAATSAARAATAGSTLLVMLGAVAIVAGLML